MEGKIMKGCLDVLIKVIIFRETVIKILARGFTESPPAKLNLIALWDHFSPSKITFS